MSLILATLAAAVCFKLSNAFAADAAAPATTTTAKAATYTVNISPPEKVGQKETVVIDLDAKTANQMAITIPNSPTPQNQNQNMETVAHLEGEGEVLAVFPNGGMQKGALTVKVFTATQNGQPVPGLPAAGAKIVAEKTGKTATFTVDDKPASAQVAALLQKVVSMGDDKHTDQEIFGPQNPVAVGATWPVNAAKMIEGLKDELGAITGVNGTMKLDSITGSGDDQVATVSGNFTIEGVQPPMPPGVTIDTAAFGGSISGSIPATATKGTGKNTETMNGKITAHGDMGGASLKLTTTVDEKKTVAVTFHQ